MRSADARAFGNERFRWVHDTSRHREHHAEALPNHGIHASKDPVPTVEDSGRLTQLRPLPEGRVAFIGAVRFPGSPSCLRTVLRQCERNDGFALQMSRNLVMRDDVRGALAIGPSSTMEERTIDITTTGRSSRSPRRIEIVFYRIDGSIYLSGIPAPRRRDWLANLTEEPRFTFHLKHDVVADLPAVATVITDESERRRLLAPLVDQFNERRRGESEWPRAELDEWVRSSPLARVDFVEVD